VIKNRWTPVRILAVGFALIILAGGLLLSLPIAARDGLPTPFLNAIFTATSAVCVTGLVVYDTWTQFSFFGQVVILILIQTGGLGFLTAMVGFSLAAHRRIGLGERAILAESIGATQLAGIVRIMKRILLGTAIIEGTGAVCLATQFIPKFGTARGIWFAVFHAVSSFCNAGFDLMGILKKSSSLTLFYDNPVVIITIALLIIIGGIGFVVWNDIVECGRSGRKLSLHSRVALISTAILIVGGTVFFLISERNGQFSGMTVGNRVLSAFFQAVTPRTAGYNSIDIAKLSEAGKACTMFLMFIGAAPGGTGGGIKVTTAAVIGASAVSAFRNGEPSLGHFRIGSDTVMRALNSTSVYCVQTMIGVVILCLQGTHFTDACFECLSAIGTVGLTVGITSGLPALSRVALILLMYIGRIGSMSIFLAVRNKTTAPKLRDPIGKIIVA